jgi:hypothetical protein
VLEHRPHLAPGESPQKRKTGAPQESYEAQSP